MQSTAATQSHLNLPQSPHTSTLLVATLVIFHTVASTDMLVC